MRLSNSSIQCFKSCRRAYELKYVEAYARTGYIGSVCGVPVVATNAVPENTAYLATKEAVTIFTKKGSEVEQERDANVRLNKVYARKVMLVALTDGTKVVKLTTGAAPQQGQGAGGNG